MPAYVRMIRLDWHVAQTGAEQQAAMMAGHQALDSRLHTAETFQEKLEEIASSHPALRVDALIEDGYRHHRLLRAGDGLAKSLIVEQRPEGTDEPIELPYDELVSIDLARDAAEIVELLANIDPDLRSSCPREHGLPWAQDGSSLPVCGMAIDLR